jgi:hypothetical protein
MPKTDVVAGVFLTLFGLLTLFVLIPTQTSEGGDASISPALLPQICAIGITGLSILLTFIGAGKLRRGEAAGQTVPHAEWYSAGAVLIAVIAGILLFKWFNPALAAGVMIVGLMLYMEERRLWLLVGIPTILIVGAWLLFYQVLGTAIG